MHLLLNREHVLQAAQNLNLSLSMPYSHPRTGITCLACMMPELGRHRSSDTKCIQRCSNACEVGDKLAIVICKAQEAAHMFDITGLRPSSNCCCLGRVCGNAISADNVAQKMELSSEE